MNTFVLKKKIKEADDTLTLQFEPANGEIFPYLAGQFSLFSFLDDRAKGRIRAYTLSSLPEEKFLSITVKKAGVFSGALHDMKIGEKINVGPGQGRFYPENKMKNLVFLAAGIGIAPFYPLIRKFYEEKSPRKVTLFYSNRTKKDAAFFKELNEIAQNWPNLKVIHFITREQIKDDCISECCRIDMVLLKKYLDNNLKGKYFFICGPREFIEEKYKDLTNCGVKEDFIKVEAF